MSNPPIKFCEDCRYHKPSGMRVPDTDATCIYPKKPFGRSLVARGAVPVPSLCSDERIWTQVYGGCGPEASRFEPKLKVVSPEDSHGGDAA